LIAGDHVPATPSFEIPGRLMALPTHTEASGLNDGVIG